MITRLTIPDMTTIHATRAIETALAMVPGISRYEIARGTATIVHDGRATADALREAVAVAGFDIAELQEDARRLH
jgi:copper chaperone CopZ